MAEKMSRRRVKLYALNSERQWDDRGTGHVTAIYVERLKGISLLVRAETDGTPLLESKIQTDTAYQKQQGTLIVWSEGDNFDLALSFQEKAGCDEIWEKICQVQGKDPSLDITQEVQEESEEERFEEANDSNLFVELPPCDVGKLEQINELLSASLQNVIRQDKVANSIENECYIKKLLELFRLCEELENIESLHILYEIFKNIFLLNKNSLLEVLFSDENIFDVVGALEYDPSSPQPKKHRDFLKSMSTFKEVIPLENSELVNKIHQTFRVQYIQDVALPNQTVFEENMPSTLSSFIFFNKVEIVSLIQDDERFLSELFLQLSSEDVPVDRRRDLILFLKEFCTFSQTLQPPNRENFYKTLNTFGVLGALECTLGINEPIIKAASIDVLGFFVEFSPSMVREYILQQQHKVDEEPFLLTIMIEQMVIDCDPEMGGAVQLMGILRILIDPENMMAANNKAERADFLAFFYKHSIQVLIAPLMSNTEGDEVVREDYQTAQLAALILELLSFCVEHHSYHVKNYIIHRDLLRRVLVFVKSKHTFLVLCAVRFIRKIIGIKDEFYNRHIVSCHLFAPLIDAYVRNDARYNLLDSAILEIFEFIRAEDCKTLLVYSMEKFGDIFSRIDYVQTFSAMRAKYVQHQDRIRDREKSTAAVESLGLVRPSAASSATRFRRDIRDMEAEEELWFASDDCDEDYHHSSLKQELLKSGASASVVAGLEEEEEEEEPIGALLATTSPHRIASSPLLQSQVEKLQKENPALTAALESGSSSSSSSSDMVSQLVVAAAAAASAAAQEEVKSEDSSPTSAAAAAEGGGISLVDYDENSDEEEEEEMEDEDSNSSSSTNSSNGNISINNGNNSAFVDGTSASTDTDTSDSSEAPAASADGSSASSDVSDSAKDASSDMSDSAEDASSDVSDSAKDASLDVSDSAKDAPMETEDCTNSVTEKEVEDDASEESESAVECDVATSEAKSHDKVTDVTHKKESNGDLPPSATNDDSHLTSKDSECLPATNFDSKHNETKTNGDPSVSPKPSTENNSQEHDSSSSDNSCDSDVKKDIEQEKKRERQEQEDSVSMKTTGSKVANNDSDAAKCESDGSSKVSELVSSTANGVASSNDLVEGENVRKRPRLAVD